MSCSVCNVNTDIVLLSDSKISANLSPFSYGISSRMSGSGKISADAGIYRNISQSLSGTVKVQANENVNFSPKEELKEAAVGKIFGSTSATLGVNNRFLSSSNFRTGKADKFSGEKIGFHASSKLYPIGDISFKNKLTNTNINVSNQQAQSANRYASIDEGIFAGNYTENNSNGFLTADDTQTFVFTNEVFTSGDLEYKFRVTYPLANPKFSYFALRAYAAFDSYLLRRPQSYKVYDILLEDPSGNLIIKYDDIFIKGDNNFTTYISQPEINKVDQATWNSDYPYMDSGSPLFLENKPYTLTFSLAYECQQYPFNDRFDFRYQQSCINNESFDPNPLLLISAIEIGNSGGVGIKKDNALNCFTKVRDKSERIQKIILPNTLFTHNFNNGIYPEASSIWRTPDYQYSNQTTSDSQVLLQRVRSTNIDYGDYISLSGSVPYVDSGRLILKFNTDRDELNVYTDGAFNFGGNRVFDDSVKRQYQYEDYFEVDYAELKVVARKHSTNADYPIDIVGYSDDKLLYVTSPVGGFLQNSGSLPINGANVPDVSGFKKPNLSISSSSISDGSEFFLDDISPIGDHYILNTSILVDSTSFKEYIIPLDIYQDPNKVGYNKYSLSSYFENLYVDICPIPSGASIAHVSLILYYKPANGLHLHTLGSPSNKKAVQKNITLLPDGSGTLSSSEQPSGLVTGLSSPSYLSTNFARRWRGHTGDIFSGGDFDRERFDFSFNHQQGDTPFLTSYIDFSHIDNADIYDNYENYVGQAGTSLNKMSTFGWRYSSGQLFANDPDTNYTSIAWSPEIKIYDSFDNAIRVNPETELVVYALNNDSLTDYGNPSNTIGFALFIRYCPDKVSTNNFNDHLIYAYENNATWNIALVCEGGVLKLKIKQSDDSILTIADNTSLDSYTFPLSILVTYNDDDTYKFKLYTAHGSNKLRAASSNSVDVKLLSNAALHIGWSQFYSTNTISMFVTEMGFSNGYCNITENVTDMTANKITASQFFDSYNVLASLIDDDISKWKLGAFKICSFSSAFDSYTKREGKDYITFNLDHPGSGYSRLTNKTLPSNINLSGVSYHTQIENDFLRFGISDIPSIDQARFYGLASRISKNLPKGYDFREEALCVDTVLEHHTNNDIMWSDGKVGPKFIVSIYAPTKESAERPSKSLGLVNRSIHHLEPSGCIRKITSKFTFNDILDNSEPWAIFDSESYFNEFKDKYLLDDVNQMFLQYDLVYPSGSPYKSKIKIHNSNIRANNAIYFHENTSGNLSLYTSGQYYQFNTLNLFAPENGTSISGFPPLNLFVTGHGPTGIHNSGLKLFVDNSSSGYFVPPQVCNLYTIANGTVDSSYQLFGGMFGSIPLRGIGLSVSGQFMDDAVMPLHAYGMAYSANQYLNFNVLGPEGSIVLDTNLNLRIRGITPSFNAYPSGSMSLHIYNDQQFIGNTNNSFNLFLSSFDPIITNISGSLPLVTLNYPISDNLVSRSATIKWDSNNIGQGITSIDNVYAYVDADDNIRGVNLACYGDCEQ
jgi:hypothetical protein